MRGCSRRWAHRADGGTDEGGLGGWLRLGTIYDWIGEVAEEVVLAHH